MTKRLRVRFIIISMMLLIVMQVFILGFTAYKSYSNIINRADKTIEQIRNGNSENMDARYFTVSLDEKGNPLEILFRHTRSVDQKTAMTYAGKAWDTGKEKGLHQGYRYRFYAENDGKLTGIFLDRSSYLDVIKSNLISGILYSSIAIFLMFFVLLFLSKQVVKPLETADRKQKEFITSASHELKTPLTVMSADCQLLKDELKENEWLFDLEQQIKKMDLMANELTELSKLEESGNDMRLLFPLSDFANEISNQYKSMAIKNEIAFQKEIEPGLEYFGNQNDICRLLAILLDNAFKYCSEKGRIEVSLSKDGKISLRVSNTVSQPYKKEELEKFFDRFYRTGDTNEKGFGIGLSVAKAITEKHKGNISACMQDEKTLCITAFLR